MSQPYKPPRPATGIAFLAFNNNNNNNFHVFLRAGLTAQKPIRVNSSKEK
jgi:hypothetical protein